MFNIDFSSQKAKPLSLDESSKLLQDQEKKHKVGYIISQFFFHGYIAQGIFVNSQFVNKVGNYRVFIVFSL